MNVTLLIIGIYTTAVLIVWEAGRRAVNRVFRRKPKCPPSV